MGIRSFSYDKMNRPLFLTLSAFAICGLAFCGHLASATDNLDFQLSEDDNKNCNNSFSVDNDYPHGYVGTLYLRTPVNITGWVTRVKMTHPFKHLSVFNGANLTCTDQVCYFANNEWNADLIAGEPMPLGFQVDYECGQPCPLPGCIKVNGGIMCGHDDDDNA